MDSMTDKENLLRYEKVNKTNTLVELSEVVLSFGDEDGMIEGNNGLMTTAQGMATATELFLLVPPNVLTRRWGIRQQALMLVPTTEPMIVRSYDDKMNDIKSKNKD